MMAEEEEDDHPLVITHARDDDDVEWTTKLLLFTLAFSFVKVCLFFSFSSPSLSLFEFGASWE